MYAAAGLAYEQHGAGQAVILVRAADVAVEEWDGGGHVAQLMAPGRFAARLRAFVARCARC